MPHLRIVLAPVALALAAAGSGHARHPQPSTALATALAPIALNDNRIPGGVMKDGVLEISLEAGTGSWHPYGASGPALPLMTFGETGRTLQTPGPLIRVREGTRVHARVHNATTHALVVHGFSSHRKTAMDTLVVAAGATNDVTFTADDPGTYYYWGAKVRKRILAAPLRGCVPQRCVHRRCANRDAETRSRVRGAVVPPRTEERRHAPISITASSRSTGGRGRTLNASRTTRAIPSDGGSSTPRRTSIRCTCTASTSASPRAATTGATRSTGRSRSAWASPRCSTTAPPRVHRMVSPTGRGRGSFTATSTSTWCRTPPRAQTRSPTRSSNANGSRRRPCTT